MRKILLATTLAFACLLCTWAQDRTVQNRPYTDLRTFHFGVLVGTHLQDLEFINAGPLTLTAEDGTVYESLVTTDQDRWDAGLQVGVLGEFRLHTNFQLRIAPAMYFGTRHLTFHDFTPLSPDGQPAEARQTIKTAYISTAVDLIVAPTRTGNHRPYLLAGINPMLNLSARDNDYLKLKRYDVFLEAGVGCDFYLPFFKLRPELKFMYGLTNCLDTSHADHLRNLSMQRYTKSVTDARSKIIALTFYFE